MGEITFLNPAQDKRLCQLIEINHRIIVHRLCATLDQRIFNQAGYHKEVVSKNVRVWIFWLFQQTLHDSSYASCQNFPCQLWVKFPYLTSLRVQTITQYSKLRRLSLVCKDRLLSPIYPPHKTCAGGMDCPASQSGKIDGGVPRTPWVAWVYLTHPLPLAFLQTKS